MALTVTSDRNGPKFRFDLSLILMFLSRISAQWSPSIFRRDGLVVCEEFRSVGLLVWR